MERKDITFRLFRDTGEVFYDEDIKDINERAIWYRFFWGSGLGGPGAIHIYTRDLKYYFIEGTPRCDHIPIEPGQTPIHQLCGVFPILFSEDENGYVKDWTLNKFGDGRSYVHKDIAILDNFLAGIEKENGQIEEYVYYETKRTRDEREAYEKHFREIRLTPEEVEWTENHNNAHPGCYTLMFRKDEKSKEYNGCIFYIDYQQAEEEPGKIMWNSPIDSYNLYYKYFYDIVGPLEINKRKRPGSTYEWITASELNPTIDEQVLNTWNLRFVRSFKTLEEAKAVVPYWAQIWADINRENLICEGTPRSDDKVVLERRLKKAELLLIFAEHHGEIIDALKKEITPGNALSHIRKKLGIGEDYDLTLFWRFMEDPIILCKESLELARKQVEEYKKRLL